jgi:enoyl-CoA hydratase/carnithine racemase
MTAPDADRLAEVGLRLDLAGPVATITLDRPSVNAQTPAMWRGLADIGTALGDETRVVVVRGAGGVFSAGLDRRLLDPRTVPPDTESLGHLLDLDDAAMADAIGEYQRGFAFLRDPRWVSIALVESYAIGAGFQLALACDLRLLAPDSFVSMREVALGLVPDLTGTKPLVDCAGYATALEICATGRDVPAAEAQALGIGRVVPEPDAVLARLVAGLTAHPVTAVREVKALLLGAGERSYDDQRRAEREAQVRRFRELAPMLKD